MPDPLPNRHRSPTVITVSDTICWPGTMPADSVISGPNMVPSPIEMYCSLNRAFGGKQMTLPSPKRPNRRARRECGPIAPSSIAAAQVDCTTSPAARLAIVRTRCTTVSAWRGRSSTSRTVELRPRHLLVSPPSLAAMTSTPEPLPFGSITDVEGVRVGHHQRVGRGWQTGTTVVFAPQGATPGVDVRGGGPGTRETDALGPANLVEHVHAICLTGGSAYGLAAADGVMAWLEERALGFTVGPPDSGPPRVVPVVPAAVIFDLGRGGDFGHR